MSEPSPRLSAPVMLPAVMVTVSDPVPVVTELMAPAPELKVRALLPLPRFRLPVREPFEVMLALSLPSPKVTFSRFEKAMEPNTPELAPDIPSVVVAVELSVSLPLPVLRVNAVSLL